VTVPVANTFQLQTKANRGNVIEIEGYSDGRISIHMDCHMDCHGCSAMLPAELVHQLRGELENAALDRVAAYARERAEDISKIGTVPGSKQEVHLQATAKTYREMAAKALAEKES